jgi:hypothetical protein
LPGDALALADQLQYFVILVLTFSTGTAGTNPSVTAIAVSDSDLYVGGRFTSAGGVANTRNIAKWNGGGASTNLYLPLLLR